MEEAIKKFATQFSWKPIIENMDNLKVAHKQIVVAGMGGSHLSTGLIKMWQPGIDLYVHRDYDMPPYDESFLKDSLLIASSYSGNTEEVLSFLDDGIAHGYSMAVMATGGKLIEKAKEYNIPYIEIPSTGIQPRSALGYSLVALAALIGNGQLAFDLAQVANVLKPEEYESAGKELAENLKGKVPVIYSSLRNLPLVYNWKIKFNETGKIPAFYNVFPELNHNEMTGFDFIDSTKELSEKFTFIFLKDRDDNEHIQKRMDVTEKIFEEKGFEVIVREINGASLFEKIFSTLLVADWTALSISRLYGTEAEQVPMVEEFKKLIIK